MTTEVNYARVREAFAKVGRELEAERIVRRDRRWAEAFARGEHRCGAIAWPLKTQCEHTTSKRYLVGWRCKWHTPAALAGRPEPSTGGCNKPLLCYGSCCVVKSAPKADELRGELQQRIEQWKAYARAEIMTLASLGYPFGPRDLAALLPLKLAGDRARDWLSQLLVEGVNAGALVQVGDASWRRRRDDEPVQHIETTVRPPVAPPVDSTLVERDNRYQ